jgi:HEAT repeat protein
MQKDSALKVSPESAFDSALLLARALGALVTQLRATDADQSAVTQRDQVRRALRAAVAAARVTSLEMQLLDGQLHLGGRALAPDSSLRDDALDALVDGLASHGSMVLDVRRSAAPGELLELARLLSTPSTVRGDSGTWRSWSVRITPGSSPVVTDETPIPDSVRAVLDRFAGARDDIATRAVVEELLRMVTTVPWRDDPVVVEAVALRLVGESRRRGARGGRLAIETGIRRLLTPTAIAALVKRLPDSGAREELMPVLARAGDLSVHALVQLLQDADTIAERRICFDAIVALDAGEEALREALQDHRWFVVRNAASLLGEMGVIEADVHLIPLLTNDDERIRIAGARALMRLGSERALIALQGRLVDEVAELRRLAAAAHGARSQGKPSTTALLNALDVELDEDVMLEIVAVLGMLGSPDAVQRLLRLVRNETGEAEPWLREAAYTALVAARGAGVQKLFE